MICCNPTYQFYFASCCILGFCMQTKEEYLTGVYKLFGAAITVPFGRLFLEIPEVEVGDLNTQFMVYSFLSGILFIVGIVLLLNGYSLAYKQGTSKQWIQ